MQAASRALFGVVWCVCVARDGILGWLNLLLTHKIPTTVPYDIAHALALRVSSLTHM